MPFITAERIHNGRRWLPAGSVIELNEEGRIIAISHYLPPETIWCDGVLAPGFVNVHCHLELSHMKGVIPEHTGLIPFLKTIPRHRNDFTGEQKAAARLAGYNELVNNGVVAVGDIANTTDTLDVRALDRLHVSTFIEAIGFNPANAQRSFDHSQRTFEAFSAQMQGRKLLRRAITPHAPYSVSRELFGLIDCAVPTDLLSIHNQESRDESRFFTDREGGICDLLGSLGIDYSQFEPSGKSSLQTYLEWLSASHDIVFVHNTYSAAEDVQRAQAHFRKCWWCLCPNANLYIEQALPDLEMLLGNSACICIGTDSLASNHGLSILDELLTLKLNFPQLDWETLLSWGAANGAEALQLSHELGAIDPGKCPGIIQLERLETGTPIVKRVF